MMKGILVTGATGFIGSHLVRALSKKDGYVVYCLTRSRLKASFLESDNVKVVEADICEEKSLEKLCGIDFEIVFHCAALVDNSDLDTLCNVNAGGSENICKLSLRKKIRRFIYLSSVAVISGNKNIPLTEDLAYSATNNYGRSKIEAEKTALRYRDKGLPLCIIRPPMVYGEDEPHMMKKLLFLLKHRMLPLGDAGKSKLHLVYVENLVAALVYALENDDMFTGSYFVADNEVLTVNEVFNCFCRGLGAKAPFLLPRWLEDLFVRLPFIGKKYAFFMKDRVYSIARLRQAGFMPPHQASAALIKSAKVLYYGR